MLRTVWVYCLSTLLAVFVFARLYDTPLWQVLLREAGKMWAAK